MAGNYSISSGQTTTANLTTKSLTVSGITGVSKTYDGSVGATLNTSSVSYSGLVSGDDFSVTPTGTFDNKNVGTGKTITSLSIALSHLTEDNMFQINEDEKYNKVLPPLSLLTKEQEKKMMSELENLDFFPQKNIAA